MKYKKKFPQKIEERERHVKTVCDICEQEIKNIGYEYNQIEINAKIGSMYPEYDTRTEYQMDICKNCFLDKVLPSLQKLGKVNEFSSEGSEFEKMEEIIGVN